MSNLRSVLETTVPIYDIPKERDDVLHPENATPLRKYCQDLTDDLGDSRPVNQVLSSEYSAKAWKVLLGALCLSVPTYGLTSAIGLFQTHWQDNQLKEIPADDISWILSVYGFLSCFLDIAAGVLFDHVRLEYYLPLGCLVYASAFLGLGWASTYAQFMGCFVVAGIFTAIPGVVAFGVVDQWFQQNHSFAIGLVTLGAPIGGTFFSVVLQVLFDKFTWKIAMVLLSSIVAGFLFIGVLLVELKVTQKDDPSAPSTTDSDHTDSNLHSISGWTFLRSRKFYLFTYTVFVFEFILYAQWGSLPAYAVFVGIGNPFYIQMTYNIGAIFARTLPPYIAKLWGPFNVCLVMILFTMTVLFAIWIPVGDQSVVGLYAVAFLMGVGTGSFTPLLASCMSDLCGSRGYGKWIGACYSFASFALLISNPISQTILAEKGPRVLNAVLGSILFTGFVACFFTRWLKLGRPWRWRVRI